MRAATAAIIALGLNPTGVQAEPDPSLTVRVYNYAGVLNKTLSSAELAAQHIFRRAGIQTEWIDCPKEPEEKGRYPACRKPTAATDVILYIVPASMEGYDVGQEAFGFALPSGDCAPARMAYVFYRRVEQAARQSRKVSLAKLLGYVMVHETGHLVLGQGMHFPRGIMRPRWQPEELRQMETGRLTFPSEHAAALRAGVQARATPCAGPADDHGRARE